MTDYKGFGWMAVVLCAALFSGCGEQKQEAAKPSAPETASAPAVAPATTPAPSETPAAAPATEPAAPAAPATATAPAAAPETKTAAVRTGEQVYSTFCHVCHAAGIAGAPKFGDKAAWGPRIKQGNDVLVQHALNGFTGKTGVMPPRGTCTTCSDQEIRNAVEYMVSKAK